jgi:hypothetical protein
LLGSDRCNFSVSQGQVTAAQMKEQILIAALGGSDRTEIRRYTEEFLIRLIPEGMSKEV